MKARTALLTCLFALSVDGLFLHCAAGEGEDDFRVPAVTPVPDDNPMSSVKINLGKMLFFDPRLSGSNHLSCASCHNPGLGWADGLPRARGHDGRELGRNTPTILNTGFQTKQFWDGRVDTLEEQALGPIANPDEMNQSLAEMIGELKSISGYTSIFERVFPGEGLTRDNVGKAIAAFERTVISGQSPFDRWQRGSGGAVDDAVKRGFELYSGKARCQRCHSGFNFTDNSFHNIGVKEYPGATGVDLGRFVIVPLPVMRGAFKTPTLRDVALTAPYMHNGIYNTLEEVIEHYDRGGDVKTNLSKEMVPLNLTAQEKQDLVSFMESLTGEQKEIIFPVLPQ